MPRKRKHSSSNTIISVVGGGAYLALLGLFGWQTWGFVQWLFPNDQLLMQILTVITFDGCALLFGCVHMLYRFANRAAKDWITVGWVITNLLSAIASVFYLVVENVYRFHLTITQTMVNTGDGISITALMFDGLILTLWVYLEWTTRHPRADDFAEFEAESDDDEEVEDLPPVYHPKPIKQGNFVQRIAAKVAGPGQNSTPVQSLPQPTQEIDYVKLAQAMQAAQPPVQDMTNGNGHSPK